MKRIITVFVIFLFCCSLEAEEGDYSLSKVTYEAIAQAQELIEASKYNEAEKALLKLEDSPRVRKELDKAYVKFYLGYFYNLKSDPTKAIAYFEEALSYDALPPDQVKNAYLNLVQLLTDKEAYTKAILNLDKLIQITEPAKAEYFVYRANAYLGLKEYRRVVQNLDEAIALEKPKPNWLSTKFYCFYMLQDYPGAIGVLKELIALEPGNKNYWLQLSSLYTETKNFDRALSSYRKDRQNGSE